MSKILKLASATSLALASVAILVSTDASFASANEAVTEQAEIVVDPDMVEQVADERAEQEIIFSGPSEVVQPIPQDVIDADREANEARAQSANYVDADAGSLRELVNQQTTAGSLDKQMHCLAGTVYFESKGESLAGQLAVAKVVLARAESSRFPDSICGVVYQPKQFSFVRGGRMPAINKSGHQWKNAVAIAKIAMNNGWESPVEGALFFHARYVNPGWRLRRMATIDNHIFYR